ncbi:MAG: peptide chain release factor N(5)-glutamine methyltransferase [Bacteroidales bacterium]|nr:peptide chain release factor N(5)-glutamine methyltransferase [Bacteroidales bacterium]
MMLLKDFIKEGTTSLSSLYPAEEARSIVLMLCEGRLGTRSYTHIVEPEYSIAPRKLKVLTADMERLRQGEPVQYVLGKAMFCDLEFKVSKDVLIPRPETEQLCQEAIKEGSMIARRREAFGKSAEPVRILDLCTGSGCIAWTVALGIPGCEVVGVDISEAALMVASSQDFSSALKEKGCIAPRFMRADVLDTVNIPFEDGFDLILANPPYVMESQKAEMRVNVLDFEPSTALFVPDEDPLLFYRAIALWAGRLLSPEGRCMVEINDLLSDPTKEAFSAGGLRNIETLQDCFERNRFIICSR